MPATRSRTPEAPVPTTTVLDPEVPVFVEARGSLWANPRHTTHSLDDIVGYVVRFADRDESRDLGYIPGAIQYLRALEVARDARNADGGMYVVDNVYVCGCRS